MATFPVDTKGKCFLCLKVIKKPFESDEEHEEKEEEGEEGVEFNFQRVHHFLKLRPKKVLSEFKQTAVLSSQALKSKNFSVLLCEECVGVAGRISDLCEELESIQMLLEYSIREMGELIRISDEEGVQNGCLSIPKIVVLLRKHTKQHCDSTIRRIPTAKVKLELIDDGEDEELVLEEEEEINDGLSDPAQELEGPMETETDPIDENINRDFRFSRLEFERSEENSELPYACPFCSNKFTLVDSLRQHAVSTHLDLLFYSAKLPHISNLEFRSCCEKLLKDLTSASTISSGYQCSQCNVGFKVMKQFHNHLFLLHFESLLLPKLAEIQNEFYDDQPSILEQALTSVPSKPAQFSCSFCSRIFPSSWKLKLHSASYHMDQFLSAAKLEHISDERFRTLCNVLYEKETESKSDDGKRVLCTHCSSSYTDRRNLMLHLLDTHYDILIGKLEDLQKNSNKITMIAASTISSNKTYVCTPCDVEFNNFQMYKYHKLKVHPEQATYTCASCGLKLLTKVEWIKHRVLSCTMRRSANNITPVINIHSVNGGGGDNKGNLDEEEFEDATHPAVQEILTKLRDSECDSSNHILCPICAENNGVTMLNNFKQLVRHVIRFHTEHFFMSLKKPEMSVSTFSGFCTQLFGKETFPAVKDAASGILIYKCIYCSAMFNEKMSIQRHQIQVHYSTLCNELKKVMEENERTSVKPINAPPATSQAFGAAAAQVVKGFVPVLSKTAQPQGPPSKVGFRRCPRCQKLFSKTTNISRHMTSLGCQLGTSAPRRTTTLINSGPNRNVFPCQYCGKILSCESNRNRHIKMHCPQAKEARGQPNYVVNPPGSSSGVSDLINSNWEEKIEDSYVISYQDDEASMDYKEEPVESLTLTDNEPGSSISGFALFSGSHIEGEEGVNEEMVTVQENNFVDIVQLDQNEDNDGVQLEDLPYEDPLGM